MDINSRWLGIPTELLMENAGKSVADVIFDEYSNVERIVCICSRTNNGGDGLVAARHLSYKYGVTVVFIGNPDNIKTAEAKKNWEIIRNLRTIKISIVKTTEDLSLLDDVLRDADIVVDAIFGVGIRGRPRGLEGEAISRINMLRKKYGFKIVSVDVPSGFDAYRGESSGLMIDPDIIVTFHDMKYGLEKLRKKIIIKSIGIPRDAEIFVGPGDFLEFIKEREPWSHKGDFGRILIIGGSKHYTGAPALSALAALRTGADLTVIYAPETIVSSIRSFSPNIIAEPYPGEFFESKLIDNALKLSERADVVVLGPGIGAHEETLKAIHEFITKISAEKKVIIDADALKSLALYGIPKNENIIITPHAGEFKLIFGEAPPRDLQMRGEITRKYAEKNNITILLKGHIDVISDGDKVLFNKTGNPGMTVGGTGDVLTGIIAAIYAHGFSPLKSAAMGAFLCGFAGDLAFEKFGYGLTATDVIDHIPYAIKEIEKVIRGER